MSPNTIALQLRKECSTTVTVTQVDYEQLGAALRQMRLDAGISLRGMAKLLKLSAPFLSDCELGRRSLRPNKLVAFISHTQTK